MESVITLLSHFFTHKDFLPPAHEWAGTMFTPLHLGFSAFCVGLLVLLCVWTVRRGKERLRTIYLSVWAVCVALEIAKIAWEALSGSSPRMEWGGVLPLYPCSIFMYAMPFALCRHPLVRRAACGYVCTLGMLGAAINFVYPATVLGNYSCLSFAGFQTFFYHGAIVFCAVTLLATRTHTFGGVTRWWELLLPSLPFLAVSLVANLVNFSPVRSDYMFFRLDSFIFAPLGAATPDWLGVVMVYALYLLLHALPYLPSYLKNSIRKRKNKESV